MVISQEDGTDVPPKWVLDHCAPAFLSMADQLLLTRLHQQESDDLQRQPVPKIFPNFELKSLCPSPLGTNPYIFTLVPQSLSQAHLHVHMDVLQPRQGQHIQDKKLHFSPSICMGQGPLSSQVSPFLTPNMERVAKL